MDVPKANNTAAHINKNSRKNVHGSHDLKNLNENFCIDEKSCIMRPQKASFFKEAYLTSILWARGTMFLSSLITFVSHFCAPLNITGQQFQTISWFSYCHLTTIWIAAIHPWCYITVFLTKGSRCFWILKNVRLNEKCMEMAKEWCLVAESGMPVDHCWRITTKASITFVH